MKLIRVYFSSIGLATFFSSNVLVAQAQIIPDRSLGNESSVVSSQTINNLLGDRITGGAIRGSNLFHSFQEFNIAPDRAVYFTNPEQINNIFTRVTGNTPSNLQGTLGVLGNANLFFLNPNGILFGKNASLDIKGSFLATSASSINFDNGFQFGSNPSEVPQLLTVTVPIGLGFNGNSAAISIQGLGNGLTVRGPYGSSPLVKNNALPSLRSSVGTTFAIVGGDVNLDGGRVISNSGRLEVGSVKDGIVDLKFLAPQSFALDYGKVQTFGDIGLKGRSLLDAGGNNGFIQLIGRQISLTESSVVTIQTIGNQSANQINVRATQSLLVDSIFAGESVPSLINSENLGAGKSANLSVTAPQIILRNGGSIDNRNFGIGGGSSITISASSLQVLDSTPIAEVFNPSGINLVNASSGSVGYLTIDAEKITITNGGGIISVVRGSGDSGNTLVNARSIDLVGVDQRNFQRPSIISTSTFGAGRAGKAQINTQRLSIRDGGRVDSSIGAGGIPGDIIINASESVEVVGSGPNIFTPSAITASAVIQGEAARSFFNLPPVPSGNSGSIVISTPDLRIGNRAAVSVKNEGTGNAGTLHIIANNINLSGTGAITASTASGEGGNINLEANNSLRLRDKSQITASANGSGNGGNLEITSNNLLSLENSNITATAFRGQGGNIEISTQAILSASTSQITASSQLGIDGVISIRTPDVNLQNSLTAIAANFVNSEQIVVGSCLTARNGNQGSFVVTGIGGVPLSPYSLQRDRYEVSPNPISTAYQSSSQLSPARNLPSVTTNWKLGEPIQEAQALIANANGNLTLSSSSQSLPVKKPQTLICRF